ncbi:hypothetical protein PFISCL1PPCAC_21025, partial [Pristionchus fissidentatus]
LSLGRSLVIGGDAVVLFSIHMEAKTGRKRDRKESLARFEGTLNRPKHSQVVQATVFPRDLQSVHMASFVDGTGKRSASVVAVCCCEVVGRAAAAASVGEVATVAAATVVEARMGPSGKLRPRARIELSDDGGKIKYEPSCASLLANRRCSSLLFVGCTGGELLLLQLQQSPKITPGARRFTVVALKQSPILKITVFKRAEINVREKAALVGVLTNDSVSLYRVVWDSETVKLLAERTIEINVNETEYTLLGTVSCDGRSHDLWLFGGRKVRVWTGEETRPMH